MKLFLFSALAALGHIQVFGQDDYCFGKDNDRPQTRQFSTKTAYQIVKGINMEEQYRIPHCEPKKLWILHRHGTRLPSAKTISNFHRLEELRDEIVKNYRVRKNRPQTDGLCPEDLITIQMWKWNNSITQSQEYVLTSQGWDDLKGTAKLYQRLFPEILTKQYLSGNFVFRYTKTQRAEDSFKAFADTLFGINSSRHIHVPDPSSNDTFLRPYDYCTEWIANENDLNNPDSEVEKFKNSDVMNETLSAISKRLGFLYTLGASDIELIFDMCRYEQAWQVDRTSAWCAAFTVDQISVLEYEEDLKNFYKSGYGNELNSRLNCAAVQDMLTQLNGKTPPHAVAYFTHSTAIQTFITALGINKDEVPLTSDNYHEMSKRRWKTSLIDPFAANLVAVKYECEEDADDPEKVMFFLNQNVVRLSWCHSNGLCDWSEVMKKYDEFYNADCEEYFCKSGSGAGTVGFSLLSLFASLLIYLIY